MKLILPFLISSALALLTGTGHAQGYSIDRFKITAGGGMSRGGAYSIRGHIPSSDSGARTTGGRYSISGNFWSLPNAFPVPLNPGLGTTRNQPATLTVRKLATDEDGDPLFFTVAAQSSASGTVALIGNLVTYTPPANFVGGDAFTFLADDGRGGVTSGTVTVGVATGMAVSLNVVSPPAIQAGNFVVRFAGIPGRTYTIESSAEVNGPWTKAANVIAPTSNQGFGTGVFEFREPANPETSRFFRTIYPSY